MIPASLLVVSMARAITWPDESAWEPVLHEGAPLEDACGDATGSDWWDVLGDATEPAAYTTWDGTHLWFRLRVADEPFDSSGGTPTDWRSFGWGVMIESDWDDTAVKYDAIVFVDGSTDEVSLSENTLGEPDFTADAPEAVLATWPGPMAEVGSGAEQYAAWAAAGTDLCGGTAASEDFFLDWAIPWTDLASTTGASDPSELGFVFGTSASTRTFGKDVSGCDATTAACTDWGTSSGDPDGDGVPWDDEVAAGTDPEDPDTDGDGLDDSEGLDYGTDPLDPDTDDGGVPDGEEVLEDGTDPLDPTDDRVGGDTGDTGPTGDTGDTGPADDTALPDDTAPPRAGLYLGGACGCAPAGPGGAAWLLLALAALARRRA